MKKVHDELERLERSGSLSLQGTNGSATADVGPEAERDGLNQQHLSHPSLISARLDCTAIESSTDTLVDSSSRCQATTNSAEVIIYNS